MNTSEELVQRTLSQLRAIQERRGISQSEIGEATGRNQSSVSGFMTGRRGDFMIRTLVSIASAVGADVHIVITPKGEDHPCPLVRSGDDKDYYACVGGTWAMTGPRGEIVASWVASGQGRKWGLWMGQGGTFGESVSHHVRHCPTCREVAQVEYV